MEKKNKDPAYLMATFSSAAYREPDGASRVFEKYVYPNHRFIEKDGAQCYVVWNDAHAVVVFRGTEPTELSDIKADRNALQSKSFSGKGDVHAGFQGEINKLWDDLTFTLADLPHRQLKITGHSLGAAMATICASRLVRDFNVDALYTFGSPRVGDRRWVRNLSNIVHYRVVNNNDMVCKVPFWIMGYRHHGVLCYVNHYGNVRRMTWWQRVKDQWRGRLAAWRNKEPFDGIRDHDINAYARKMKNVVLGD